MRIPSETKIFLGILVATVVIIGIGLMLFSKPEVTISREDLIPQGAATVGPKDAKVYLVEFSDFQCPSCKKVKPYLDELLSTEQDKIYFSYRHFPLQQHQFAFKGALAAEAAGEQGKFWEMYNFLFQNQEKLSDETINEGAKSLSLDMDRFQKAINSDIYKNKIQKDMEAGIKYGVEGTPTFFLNGKKMELSSFSDLKKSVDETLAK